MRDDRSRTSEPRSSQKTCTSSRRRTPSGTSLAAATVEYRQRFGESYGVVAFVDAGEAAAASIPSGKGVRAGAGIGARYYTAIGPIRADIAIPLNKQRGDDTFEFYIGIGESF